MDLRGLIVIQLWLQISTLLENNVFELLVQVSVTRIMRLRRAEGVHVDN